MTESRALARLGVPLVVSFAAAVLALLLFAWLAEEMWEGATTHFDDLIRQTVHAHSSPAVTSVMRIFTFIGSELFISIAALGIAAALWLSLQRHSAVFLAITVAGGMVLLNVLKFAFHRPRPVPFFDTPLPASYSFPSGHALVSFCFFAALAILACAGRRRWSQLLIWCIAALIVLMIGVSRIYLGVHYPSDVVAGYLAGTFWVLGAATGFRRIRPNRI